MPSSKVDVDKDTSKHLKKEKDNVLVEHNIEGCSEKSVITSDVESAEDTFDDIIPIKVLSQKRKKQASSTGYDTSLPSKKIQILSGERMMILVLSVKNLKSLKENKHDAQVSSTWGMERRNAQGYCSTTRLQRHN